MGNFIEWLLGKKEIQVVEKIQIPERKRAPNRSKEVLIARNILRSLGKKLP